jgi:hypothetical protein
VVTGGLRSVEQRDFAARTKKITLGQYATMLIEHRQHTMKMWPIAIDLPPALYLEIGRAITRYAVLEFHLREIVCTLLGIGPKEGRLTLRSNFSGPQLIELIRDLLPLKKITVPVNLSDFKKSVSQVCEERNQLAHGVWVRHPGTGDFGLQLTTGEWKPPAQKAKRQLKPEAIPYGPKQCQALRERIDEVIETASALHNTVVCSLKEAKSEVLE